MGDIIMTAKKQTTLKIDWRIVVSGIAALTIIEVCALLQGINGTLMTLIVAIIGLAIGVVIPKPKIT